MRISGSMIDFQLSGTETNGSLHSSISNYLIIITCISYGNIATVKTVLVAA